MKFFKKTMVSLSVLVTLFNVTESANANGYYSADVYHQADGRIYDSIAQKRWATITETQGMSLDEVTDMVGVGDWYNWRVAEKDELDELVANYLGITDQQINAMGTNLPTEYSTSAVSEIVDLTSEHENIGGLAKLFQGDDLDFMTPEVEQFDGPCENGFVYTSWEGCSYYGYTEEDELFIDDGRFVSEWDEEYGYMVGGEPSIFASTFVTNEEIGLSEDEFLVEGFTAESYNEDTMYIHRARIGSFSSEEEVFGGAQYNFYELDQYNAPSWMAGLPYWYGAEWNSIGQWNSTIKDSIINNLGTFLVFDIQYGVNPGIWTDDWELEPEDDIIFASSNDDDAANSIMDINSPIAMSALGLILVGAGLRGRKKKK